MPEHCGCQVSDMSRFGNKQQGDKSEKCPLLATGKVLFAGAATHPASNLAHDKIGLALPAGFKAGMQPRLTVPGADLKVVLQRERSIRVFRRDGCAIFWAGLFHLNHLPGFGLVDMTIT